MTDEIFSLIYNKALDIISRREHSEKEIREKLYKKFNDHKVSELVITSLIEKGLVNDHRFAEMYIIARKRKGFGPKKIAYELLAKGVSDDISSQALNEEGGWRIAALNAFNKKYKNGIADNFKEMNKQKIFLQNRGFTFEEIDSVFS
ncbi:MAG: regulatory protein RecX [Gammaproteobacteria bacterium]|jgi:regulatory protein|nr:regulatory protein RecX [Pseudomonadota bacterium]NCX24441.1 regulatory protein RecX [Pseudomonadota bacterium]NCX30357.1 regulatory protein RecX [Pseudomonadota bacterium]NCX34190.1 regulatory protein RecX [Pseudomonadota bacterium]